MFQGPSYFSQVLISIYRHFKRRFFYSSLNTAGLTLAYATVILTLAYVYFETSYDKYHTNQEQIYRVTYAYSTDDFNVHWARVPVDWVNEMPSDLPEIKNLIRFQNQEQKYIRVGEDRFKPQHAFITDSEVFDVFDYELITGSADALIDPYSVVLTESTASRYFGSSDVLGQQIYVSGTWDSEEKPYQVTGVIRDLPANSHMPVEMLFSFTNEEERSSWAYVYVLLDQATNIETVRTKSDQFKAKYLEQNESQNIDLSFQPLSSIHLESNLAREIQPNSSWMYVKIFMWVGLFIWVIAMVNFTNLSTAIMLERSKEIGVRKILGASKGSLIRNTIMETIGFSAIAMLIASGVVLAVWPYFSAATGVTTLPPTTFLWITLGSITLLTGFLAGIYPATTMVSSNILNTLRYNKTWSPTKRKGVHKFKNGLIGIQFTATLILLGSALVGHRQLQYLSDKNLGINSEQIIALPNVPDPVKQDLSILRHEFEELPGVIQVSACMEVPSREIRDSGPVLLTGKNQDKEQAPLLDVQVIDPTFTQLMGMTVLAGNDLSSEPLPEPIPTFNEDLTPQNYLLEQRRKYLVNETGMRKLGFDRPEDILGEEVSWSIGSFELASGPIAGVVQDYHQETLKNTVDPMIMVVEPLWLNTFLVKVSTNDIEQTMASLESIWKERYPYVMEYHFLDELYENLYKNERVQLSQLSLLAVLAIIIAFIGLVSLIAYSLESRRKEIAIRRVVGADFGSLMSLLGKTYLWIILLASVVAIPVSYYAVSRWLEEFAYRIHVPWDAYGLSLLSILTLLVVVLLVQLFRSQRSNPVHALRDE